MTQASICTIGDEILIGQIVDTNSSHISQALNTLGIKVTRMLSIGDDHDTIVNALEGELSANDIVISSLLCYIKFFIALLLCSVLYFLLNTPTLWLFKSCLHYKL